MSMTREEAISILEESKRQIYPVFQAIADIERGIIHG